MEKLDPKAVWLFFFRFLWIGIAFLVLLGAIFFPVAVRVKAKIGPLAWAILSFPVFIWILGSYGWAKLSYNAYKFELTEDAFKKEHGVIWKRYVSIPYERIQNVDIQRGVLARLLGLSDLMIQTAGYSGGYYRPGIVGFIAREPEGRLLGLSQKRAEEIREKLIKRAKSKEGGV